MSNETVKSIRIYDFEESLKDSGLPMNTDYDTLKDVKADFNNLTVSGTGTPLKLARAEKGSGHDTLLKGIQVRMVIDGTRNFWLQWMRYHFEDVLTDIVSSQSLMHKITTFNIKDKCCKEVSPSIMEEFERLQSLYLEAEKTTNLFGRYQKPVKLGWITVDNSRDFKKVLIANIPCGFKLTASVATNMLQLKTLVYQRSGHLLPEWQDMIKAIKETKEWKILFGEDNGN